MPLKDLDYLGGWKDPRTLLTCDQQPDHRTQRRTLEARRKLEASGLESFPVVFARTDTRS
jgi:hypothetical protein